MSTTSTFPNGQQLISSALTPFQMEAIFQLLTTNILGLIANTPFEAMLAAGSAEIVLQSPATIPKNSMVTGVGIPLGDETTVLLVNGINLTLSNPVMSSGVETIFFTEPNANTTVRIAWQTEGAPAWALNQDIVSIQAVEENNDYDKIRDVLYTNNDSTSLNTQWEYTRVWRITWTARGPNAFDRIRLIKSALLLDWTHDTLAPSNLYLQPNFQSGTRIVEHFEGQWWERCDFSALFYEQVNESIVVNSVLSTEVLVYNSKGLQIDVTIPPTVGE